MKEKPTYKFGVFIVHSSTGQSICSKNPLFTAVPYTIKVLLSAVHPQNVQLQKTIFKNAIFLVVKGNIPENIILHGGNSGGEGRGERGWERMNQLN